MTYKLNHRVSSTSTEVFAVLHSSTSLKRLQVLNKEVLVGSDATLLHSLIESSLLMILVFPVMSKEKRLKN